ncbi:hypothetical protein LTR85_005973 [Meristemomyces frigidus]|nr:hypothetical protein LTR85_005973 [Meristemomyces frigidus]
MLAIAQWFQGEDNRIRADSLRDRAYIDDGPHHKKRIAQARQLKGGWELWLQVELALELLDCDWAKYRFVSEEAIFTNGGRVDLWGKPFFRIGGAVNEALGLELKCEYEGRDPRKAFLEDVAKVMGGIKVGHVGCLSTEKGERITGTTVRCLLVTTNERDLNNLERGASRETLAKIANHKLLFAYTRVLTARNDIRSDQWAPGEGPINLWLVWFDRHWYSDV